MTPIQYMVWSYMNYVERELQKEKDDPEYKSGLRFE